MWLLRDMLHSAKSTNVVWMYFSFVVDKVLRPDENGFADRNWPAGRSLETPDPVDGPRHSRDINKQTENVKQWNHPGIFLAHRGVCLKIPGAFFKLLHGISFALVVATSRVYGLVACAHCFTHKRFCAIRCLLENRYSCATIVTQ